MTTDLQIAMREANHYAKQSGQFHTPYAEQDIRFAAFIQHLRDECTQRERDLVYFSENFYRVYTILHIDVKTLRSQLSERDMELVEQFAQCATRLGFQHLITDGLPKKLAKLFHNATT
jgi:hypothetical protein